MAMKTSTASALYRGSLHLAKGAMTSLSMLLQRMYRLWVSWQREALVVWSAVPLM